MTYPNLRPGRGGNDRRPDHDQDHDRKPIGQAACRKLTTRILGLPKTTLEHNIAAVAINLIRLDAWWTRHPLDRTRTSHFQRLQYELAA